MVIEAVQEPVAWFLPCSSCKGSEEKGEREEGLLPRTLLMALKCDPTSGATKLAV